MEGRSHYSLFQPKKIDLNTTQERTLSDYSKMGLTPEDFIGREWFNDSYHQSAFSYLVEKKECSIDRAFVILDKLKGDQAFGIFHGMSREEVTGLNRDQIGFFLKYGLAKEDVIGLNHYQINLVLALKNDGIRAEDIRAQKWIIDDSHSVALLYLMRIKSLSFLNACKYLEDLNPIEAKAIFYGMKKNEVKGLKSAYISRLIKRKESDGLQSRAELAGLNDFQISIVENLYHFGMTSELVRTVKVYDSELSNSIRKLVWNRGILIKDLLPLISGLNSSQVCGLADGLSRDDVLGLNQFQIKTLLISRTIKNGLCANDLRNKEWFNSEKHEEALVYMLQYGKFTVTEALNMIDGLSGDHAAAVSHGKKREDIIDLNKFHLKTMRSGMLSWKIKESQLHGKDWFNSDIHVAVLEQLVIEMKFSIEDALTQMNGLSIQDLKLIKSDNIKPDVILTLTPVQKNIIENKHSYHFYGSCKELETATWLKLPEQAELLKISCEISTFQQALDMVKHVSETQDVKVVLAKLKSHEITLQDLEIKFSIQGISNDESENRLVM